MTGLVGPTALSIVELEQHGDCAVIRLNRQEQLNALSFGLLDLLDDTLDAVRSGPARALIITGAGDRAFCAGADIAELIGRPMAETRAGSERGQAVFQKIDDLPIPSIALINGYAFGGGLELAMACTFRLAVPNAKMGLPEIKLGLIPGYGGTQRLSRLIGQARAMELILTGATIGTARALELGLINRVVEGDALEQGALQAACDFAAEFTGYSLVTLRLARDAVRRSADTALNDGLKSETELSTLAYATDDSREGMAAFLAKRKPVFGDH
jgi:enoyl-CoA hydratase